MSEVPKELVSAASSLLPKLLELKETQTSPVVLIDGRAGSGKSTLAEILKNLVFKEEQQSPKIVHMDDLYPGWDGLEAGSLYLNEQVLKPLALTGRAEWQRWDWSRGVRGGVDQGNGWRSFEGQNLLIVEGCGSVTDASKAFANFTVWVESAVETRKVRFQARDQGRFADQWTNWSVQEEEFFQAHKSKELCDLVVEN